MAEHIGIIALKSAHVWMHRNAQWLFSTLILTDLKGKMIQYFLVSFCVGLQIAVKSIMTAPWHNVIVGLVSFFCKKE